MTPIPLDQIRLDWRSHKSALWWLGLLYRKPAAFRAVLAASSNFSALAAAIRIYLHTLPYSLLVAGIGRWLLVDALGLLTKLPPSFAKIPAAAGPMSLMAGVGGGFALIVVGWVTISVLDWLVERVVVSRLTLPADVILIVLPLGIGGGVSSATTAGISSEVWPAFAIGVVVAICMGLTLGIPRRPISTGPVVGVGTLLGGFFAIFISDNSPLGVALAAGGTIFVFFTRLYYLPIHLCFLWPLPKGQAYRYHPVAWDDCCWIPCPQLNELLVAYADLDSRKGRKEIRRLIDHYPSQRRQALRAQTVLIARETARATDLARLDDLVAHLPEGRRSYLAETRRLREKLHRISVLAARLVAVERPYLKEAQAALLLKEIELFEQQIAGFRQPLATEFRAAAQRWLELASAQHSAARAVASGEPIRQVFRAGDPVDRQQEAFVPRDGVFGELERQVLLATGCPGLLLYGRRRTGKSTVLKNVASFLPARVSVAWISMQKAEAFTSLPHYAALLSRTISETLASDAPSVPEPNDLVSLDRYLAALDRRLIQADRRLLLALDEYEYLDRKIGEGVFNEDLLAVLRESIQSHRRIIWAFAGSHAIEELTNAAWTSYLVSVRTVEVPMFTSAETQLLLTEPMKYSSHWRADDATRPRFEPGFWGERGIERIHREANGWPHLVQLLAERVVDRMNDTGALRASPDLLEQSFDIAVERGHNTLFELMQKESALPGEWEYLLRFKRSDEQPPPEDEAIARSLRRRLLISEDGDRWRLVVPLMARWLRLRG